MEFSPIGVTVQTEQLIGQLNELRTRATGFHRRATSMAVRPEGILDEALAELGVALEELRVTEDELRSQNDRLVLGAEDRFRRLRVAEDRFEWAPDAMIETDRKGVIRAANRAAGRLLGARVDLLRGKPIAAFVALEDRRAFRDGLRSLLRSDGAVQDWTMRVNHRSGPPRQVEWRVRAVPAHGEERAILWGLRLQNPNVVDARAPLRGEDELPPDAELALRSMVIAATALAPAAGAGLMLADSQGVPRWVTATDPLAQAFEDAQASLREGPCIDVLGTPEVIWTTDVTADARWPQLGELLRGKGIGSVMCAPLVVDGTVIGSFNLFTSEPVSWITNFGSVAETLAAMSVLLLRGSTDLRRQQTLAAQLQLALDHRAQIEQAKGVLMARHDIDQDEAWRRLRDAARITRRKAVDVAAEIVAGKSLPPDDG